MAKFNLKSGNTTPFKMMGSSPLHAKSKLVSKANKPSEKKPSDPYAYENLNPEKREELRSHFEKPDVEGLNYPLIPAESVSTSVAKPIVPIVEKEEEPTGVPPGFFSETGFKAERKELKKKKKKKNILQSFTDFITSKIDKKQSLIR